MVIKLDGRGGARPGAGRHKTPLAEKIAKGNPSHRPMTKIEPSKEMKELEGVDMPPPSDFLSATERNGKPLGADKVYEKTFRWLAQFKCEHIVSPILVEQYSVCVARWVICEEEVSKLGYIGRHPTSGAPIKSPFVSLSQEYMKRANSLWNEIFNIVKENSSVEVSATTPTDDFMELLLRKREQK